MTQRSELPSTGTVQNMASPAKPPGQKVSWKSLAIGISIGVVSTFFVVAAVKRSRPAMWDTKAVSVVWSEADNVAAIKNHEFTHVGFSLHYALQNSTDQDMTIPENATIMKRLTNGGVLVTDSSVKPSAPTFLPARQRAQLSLNMQWGCGVSDMEGKELEKEFPEPCFDRAFADSDGFVLFDYQNHLQIPLPKPILVKPKR
jgi:hypothetical protein